MAWLEDIASVLTAAGLGARNATIFLTSKSLPPSSDITFFTIIETSGSGDQRTHNTAPLPTYIYPGAQILIRGTNPADVIAKARLAYLALAAVRNQIINGTRYREITPQQWPFDLGLDDTSKRIVYSLNVLGDCSLP